MGDGGRSMQREGERRLWSGEAKKVYRLVKVIGSCSGRRKRVAPDSE